MTLFGPALRVLLLSDSSAHTKDMLQAWQDLQETVSPYSAVELVHYIFTPKTEGLGTVALLDRIRAGVFHLVFVVQPRLAVSLSCGGFPVGMHAATTVSDQVSSTIVHAVFCFWVSQQALACNSCQLVLTGTEGTGTHLPNSGTALWSFRELQNLDNVQGAQRGAEFLCQLSDGDAAIPIGYLTNVSNLFQTLHAGWPAFEKSPQAWTYTGPLPLSCQCRYIHHPISREGSPIGPGFWKHCLKTFLQSSANETLRDGVAEISDSCVQRGEWTYTCPREPHLAPSLSACANSLSHVYEHWCLRESLEDALDELGLGAHTGYQSLALETVCSCVSWPTAHSVVATAAASGSPRTLLTDAPRTVRPVKVASSCIAVPGKHFSSFRPRGTEKSSDQYSSLSPQRKRVKMSQIGGTENAKENPNDSVLTVCASDPGKQAQEIVAGTQTRSKAPSNTIRDLW